MLNMLVKDRLSLLLILPTLGSISEMVDVFDLAKLLKLNDDEKRDIEYIEIGDSIKWNIAMDPNKLINLTSDLYKIVMEQIEKLNEKKLVPLSMIELILKLKEYGEYKNFNSPHT